MINVDCGYHRTNACQALKLGCFAAGTKLWTESGWKSIEEIIAGEKVYSRSEWEPASVVELREVEEVFVRTGIVFHLHLQGGKTIRTTGEHPFYKYNTDWKGWEDGQPGEWVPASSLTTNDFVMTHDGSWLRVEELFDTGEWEVVYNLRVSEHHTYFVGEDEWAVWAHNAVCWGDFLAYNKGRNYAPGGASWMSQTGAEWTNNFKPAYAGTPGSSWTSRSGLLFGLPRNPTPSNPSDLQHVEKHTVDNPTRPSPHGVFDAGNLAKSLTVIDEAWSRVVAVGYLNSPVDGVWYYPSKNAWVIDMRRRIGYQGGVATLAGHNNPANYIRIAATLTGGVTPVYDIITAFPQLTHLV